MTELTVQAAPTEEDLSREELLRLLEAVRQMTRVTAEPDLDPKKAVQALLGIAAAATASDRCNVYAHDVASARLVLLGHFPFEAAHVDKFRVLPLEGSRTGIAIREGRSDRWTIGDVDLHGVRPDELGVVQIAVVPLRAQGRVIAAMNVARNGDRPHDERELHFVQILGELLVVYLENVRLYEDARRRLEETTMLLDVARSLGASLDPADRLGESCAVLVRLIDASNAFLFLLEDDDRFLQGVATSNAERRAEFRHVRTPMSSTSIAVQAVQSRMPVSIDDALSSELVRPDLVMQFGQKSLLALPLLVQDRAIGAVVIDDMRTVRRWTQSEVERAALIAQSVSVAIANARLYDEIRRRSLQLESAQQELVRRERLAALGQLAATLAHEVRNPLAVLFNSLGTLGKTIPASGDTATLLRIMSEEAQRLERLVRELLDFARPLAPAFESESFATILAGAVDAAVRAHGPLSIAVEVAANVPVVRVDGSMVRRAILNLIVNGVHAAGPTGSVRIRASVEPRGRRTCVRVDVSDSGAGIPANVVPRIFEPFFTTKARGTGLGLAVVKSIVESHSGEVVVASTVGAGTTMSVFIPIDLGRDEGEPPPRCGW